MIEYGPEDEVLDTFGNVFGSTGKHFSRGKKHFQFEILSLDLGIRFRKQALPTYLLYNHDSLKVPIRSGSRNKSEIKLVERRPITCIPRVSKLVFVLFSIIFSHADTIDNSAEGRHEEQH